MALTYKEYDLNESSVEEISADLQVYLTNLNQDRRNIQRLRLTVEELLLNIMEGCGKGIRLSVSIGRRFGRYLLRIRYKAPPFDPTENEDGSWSEVILRNLGFSPAWSHKGAVNTVSLILAERRKRSATLYMVLAVLAAALLGVVGPLLPEAFRQTVGDVLLAPLADGYMGLLKTFSGIMILVAVCSGIFGMGNQEALVRTGRSVTLRIAAISIAVCIGTMGLVQPFVHLQFNEGMQGSTEQVKAVSKMIFDILPSDPVEPFRIGNYIQIIIIVLFIGTGLLAIGERGARIRSLIEDLDALIASLPSGGRMC